MKETDGKISSSLDNDTHSIFPKTQTPPNAYVVAGESLNSNQTLAKFKNLQVGWQTEFLLVSHPSFRQTISEDLRDRKQRYFLALDISEANLTDCT